jgi:hypothetical protein
MRCVLIAAVVVMWFAVCGAAQEDADPVADSVKDEGKVDEPRKDEGKAAEPVAEKSMLERIQEAVLDKDSVGRKPRNLFSACRKEIKRLCGGRRGVQNCLVKNMTLVEDPVCSTWLGARAACQADVEKSTCATKPFRACLMKLDAGDLSSECSDSDFFKSFSRTTNLIRKRRLAANARAEEKEAKKQDDAEEVKKSDE